MIAEVLETHRDKAAEKGIAVESTAPDAGLRVLADREALVMIFGNLVENALKYTPANGHVRVTTEREGIYARVSVRDDGIGIAPQDCPRIFDEYYRARNEHTAAITGTGLGLSLVKRLTELHEGTVSVASAYGEGSEFTVRLPALSDGPSGADDGR